MTNKQFWQHTLQVLESNTPCFLLMVVNREGPAPNREGAKLLLTQNTITGTIGGGRSEHLVIEKARQYFHSKQIIRELLRLNHNKADEKDSSGMICSGSQEYVICTLLPDDISTVSAIISCYENKQKGVFSVSAEGLVFYVDKELKQATEFTHKDSQWSYQERIQNEEHLYIVGGGHCSLALSKIMIDLGFYVTVYENRTGIKTFEQNSFAHEKHIVDYDSLQHIIPEGEQTFITIMTYGHEYDQFVLEKLVKKNVRYLGMMGSQIKVNSVYDTLIKRGTTPALLKKVHAPIGIDIGKSDTPEEIAISIAAELLKERQNQFS